jgi:hypothetical protein
MKKLIYLLIAMAGISLSSCEYEVIPGEPVIIIDTTGNGTKPDYKFSVELAPIFISSRCVGCHSSGKYNFTTALTAYNSLNDNGLVNKTTPASSKVYTALSPGTSHVGGYLSVAERTKLLEWITRGAKY